MAQYTDVFRPRPRTIIRRGSPRLATCKPNPKTFPTSLSTSAAAEITSGSDDTTKVATDTTAAAYENTCSAASTTSVTTGNTSGSAAAISGHKDATEVATKSVRFHPAALSTHPATNTQPLQCPTTPTKVLKSCLKRKREPDDDDTTDSSSSNLSPPPPPRTPTPKSFEERERERRRASNGSHPTLTLAQGTYSFMCRIPRKTEESAEKKALRKGWANYEASSQLAEREHQKNEAEKDRLIALRHELAMERWAYESRMYQSFRATGRMITEPEMSLLVSAFANTYQDTGNTEVEQGWEAYATATRKYRRVLRGIGREKNKLLAWRERLTREKWEREGGNGTCPWAVVAICDHGV